MLEPRRCRLAVRLGGVPLSSCSCSWTMPFVSVVTFESKKAGQGTFSLKMILSLLTWDSRRIHLLLNCFIRLDRRTDPPQRLKYVFFVYQVMTVRRVHQVMLVSNTNEWERFFLTVFERTPLDKGIVPALDTLCGCTRIARVYYDAGIGA